MDTSMDTDTTEQEILGVQLCRRAVEYLIDALDRDLEEVEPCLAAGHCTDFLRDARESLRRAL